jgi:alcohol dehydrogenase class IV
MDALAHAIETFISKKSNVVSDMYGLEAVKRIFKSLPTAYHDGQNEWAREEMSIGSYFAGMCINLSAVTVVHGMSRPIGALFHVPHGISNAMLMGDCLEYIEDGCIQRYAIMARAIGAAAEYMDDKEAAKAFIKALSKLANDVEIPTLREYGINKEEFDHYLDKMVDDAMMSGSPQNSIRPVDKNDLRTMYRGLWK